MPLSMLLHVPVSASTIMQYKNCVPIICIIFCTPHPGQLLISVCLYIRVASMIQNAKWLTSTQCGIFVGMHAGYGVVPIKRATLWGMFIYYHSSASGFNLIDKGHTGYDC